MKLLYLTLDTPLDIQQVATGNQVRVLGIREVLEDAGHEVVQLVYSSDPDTAVNANIYHSREELEALVGRGQFDVIIVAYWSLLADLPTTEVPIILDFIAPRLLELMFQAPESVPATTNEIVSLLSCVDHILVGNKRQSDLLLPLLLQAGIDCRQDIPISILPISTRAKLLSQAKSARPVKLVNAGVDWPWRNFSNYRAVIKELVEKRKGITFVEFSGAYPGNAETEEAESSLQSYAQMQASLQQCHIGLELGERNTEREFSHSFRAMEYLESGLPIIINSWIPLAELIIQYDAGWVVDEPSALHNLLLDVENNPEILQAKQAGVINLKNEVLNYKTSCAPLLKYLSNPYKVDRFAKSADPDPEVEDVPESDEKADFPKGANASTSKIILASIFKKFFCPARPESTPDILMVTRSDLFPVDHGAAVKIIRTAESLSRRGRDVWLTTDSRKEYFQFSNGEMMSHRFPLLVRLLCLPRFLAFMTLIRKGYPVSNSFLYLPVTDFSYIVRSVYLTSRKPIGAYQAEFPAYVRPCRYARSLFGGKILLVQHNVEYDRIKNQVSDLSDKNFQTLKNIEIAMCHLADNIVAVSDNDRQKMISDGVSAEKIHTIPHGVDLLAFQQTPTINIKANFGIPADNDVLVYHGTYSYAPNLEAMKVMAEEILPRLKLRGLAVSVLAIGSKPPDFPLHEDIYFVGSIDDLAEVIPAADLAVVTLQEGGGTRMKILDYFAAGVPVISTSKGIEGIPVENGVEALIIDDFDAISDAIENLLNNPQEGAKLSEAASRFVDSLGWDSIARRYLPLLQ
ncbi:MAG: glycosyltransferase involved in cell wall biosynthesis [Pseudohongiellaceae bacterium]|jgi:glycosyltransferase involved in cell wall biosynthesis